MGNPPEHLHVCALKYLDQAGDIFRREALSQDGLAPGTDSSQGRSRSRANGSIIRFKQSGQGRRHRRPQPGQCACRRPNFSFVAARFEHPAKRNRCGPS